MSRYIDADAIYRSLGMSERDIEIAHMIEEAPSIDICFCRECKYVDTKKCPMYFMGLGYTDNDFCSYGEREGE